MVTAQAATHLLRRQLMDIAVLLKLNVFVDKQLRQNFIVLNMSSIIRCLSGGKGIAVIPDFLSKRELDAGQIKLIWKGYTVIENTLYFGTRKRTIYSEEIKQIEAIFLKEMEPGARNFD